MGRVYAVGVGPGSPEYVTAAATTVIRNCDIVAGYKYTINTIQHLLDGQEVIYVTMSNQEDTYQRIARTLMERTLVIPFTGDVNFSESEVVDRLAEIFGDITLIPGISSIQVAAALAQVPLDRCRVISMHVTGDIELKKTRMLQAIQEGMSVILVPRPWPSRPDLEFMPAHMAAYLTAAGVNTDSLKVHVYERLTMPDQEEFHGTIAQLADMKFSDMTVVVLDQNRPDSYMNYKWQWEQP